MKRMLQASAALVCAIAAMDVCAQAPAGFVTLTESALVTASNVPVSNATACLQINASSVPIGVNVTIGKTVVKKPICVNVVSGAYSLVVPNTNMTRPKHVQFALTVTDNVTGRSLLDSGYDKLQPSSIDSTDQVNNPDGGYGWCTTAGGATTCNVDSYTPNQPALAVVQPGPAGPPLNARGAWSSGTIYAVGDLVSYSGQLYVATANNSNATPTSSGSWQALSVTATVATPIDLKSQVQNVLLPQAGGTGLINGPSLTTWYAALHNCNKQRVRLGIFGDSRSIVDTGLAAGASTNLAVDFGSKWPDRIRKLAQSSNCPSGGTGIVPFVFGWQNTQIGLDYFSGAPVSTGWNLDNPTGPYQSSTANGNGVVVQAQVNGFTIPFNTTIAYDHLNMYCVTGPNLHAWTMYVDGANVGACGGPAGSVSATLATSSAFPLGQHSASVVCATAVCDGFALEGVAGTVGLIVDNMSFGSCAAECYGLNPSRQLAFADLAPGGYSGVILPLLTNEPGIGYSTSSFQASLNAIISHERATASVPSIVIPAPIQDSVTLTSYYPILQSVAAAQSTAYFDMRDRWGTSFVASLFGPDGIHENNAGAGEMFSRMASTLFDAPTQSAAVGNCLQYGPGYVQTGTTTDGPICGLATIANGTLKVCTTAPPPSAIANWVAGEGTGTTLYDSIGTNNLTTSGTVTWTTLTGLNCAVPSYASGAYALAGSGANTNFSSSQPFSISTWIKPTSLASSSFEAIVGNYDGTNGWLFGVDGTLRPDLQLITAGSGSLQTAGGTIAAGSLYNLIATYDGSSTAAGINIYINGVQQTQSVVTNTLTGNIATTNPVRLNNIPSGAVPLIGVQYGTTMYNRFLSAADAAAIYAAGVR